MAAPTLGSSYMEVAPTPPNPPNKEEQDILALFPPAFTTSWNKLKYRLPVSWQNNVAVIWAIHLIAADYAPNAPVTNP